MKTRAAKGRSLFSLAALCLALVAVPAQAARLLPSSPSLDAAPRVAELVDLQQPSSPHVSGLPLFTLEDHWLVTVLSVVDAPEPGALLPRERYRLFAVSQSLPPPVKAALIAKLASGPQTWASPSIYLERRDLSEKSHRLSFQGLWTDPATGLAYARNRWYDPHNASWMSEDPALDVDSTNLYAFVGWGPQESTDPTGEVALIDNAIGGVVSVAIGWGSSKLCEHFAKTDEDKASCAYSWKDATIDFGLGFATSGLSSINKVAKLGKVGRFVIRGVAEMALDTGLEAARKEWKGEDYDLGTLAQGAARNFAIGEAGSLIGRKLVGKFKKAIDFSEDVAESFRAPRGGAGARVLGVFSSIRDRAQTFLETQGVGRSSAARRASASYFREQGRRILGSGPRETREVLIGSRRIVERLELHHRFIPNRWRWVPNQIRHHRLNLRSVYSLEHALRDPYRYTFLPRWVKEAIETGNLPGI